MKNLKKIACILLTVVMFVSMMTTVGATDITISGGAEGASYAAYKLLNATDGGDGKFAYTLNEKYDDILASVTGETESAEIVDYISSLDTDGIRAFADAVYAAIDAADPEIEADYTTDSATFEDVAQGYYLIAETNVANEADTISLVMLDTKGEETIEVNTKEGKPSVDKEVEEKNDTTGAASWGEHADYDVNDVINYKITGTVSEKYASYKSYFYKFTDSMDKGLTYNEDAKVYVVNGDSKVEVTEYFTIVSTANAESGYKNGFTATSNLKEIPGITVDASTTVLVEYTATLNEYSLKGEPGNENVAYLEYENNPYHEADGDDTPDTPNEPEEPGKTIEDITIVYTYNTVVNKVDKDGAALEGAGFTLYKYSAEAGDWLAVGEELKGDALTTFVFEGVDIGKYKIVETTVPAGYNKCDDVEFEVVAEYSDDEDPQLEALKVKDKNGAIVSEGEKATFSATAASGVISTDIVNLTGAELPGTGGIGTTIFYIAGAVLVLAAVVLLVTKKRMNASK